MVHHVGCMSSTATLRGASSLYPRPVRSCAPHRVRRQVVAVRASDKNINLEQIKETYVKITNSLPPVVTAATVPVIALSLICKALTGEFLR